MSRNAIVKAILAAEVAGETIALPFRLLGLVCSTAAELSRTVAWYLKRHRR